MNGKPVPEKILDQLKEDEKEAVSEKFKVILKAPTLLKRFVVFLYLW